MGKYSATRTCGFLVSKGSVGYGFRRLLNFSHDRGLADRESFVAQYLALALFTIGVASSLGMDDLLAAFAAGTEKFVSNSLNRSEWIPQVHRYPGTAGSTRRPKQNRSLPWLILCLTAPVLSISVHGWILRLSIALRWVSPHGDWSSSSCGSLRSVGYQLCSHFISGFRR